MRSANGGLPVHRYTPQVTQGWPRGSEPASPLTLIGRRDAFPVAGTQWSQLCISFANWGQLARNLSYQFIIGVAYCDDKDATILANLWEPISRYVLRCVPRGYSHPIVELTN